MIRIPPELAGYIPVFMAMIAAAFLGGLALYTRRQARPRRRDHPAE